MFVAYKIHLYLIAHRFCIRTESSKLIKTLLVARDFPSMTGKPRHILLGSYIETAHSVFNSFLVKPGTQGNDG